MNELKKGRSPMPPEPMTRQRAAKLARSREPLVFRAVARVSTRVNIDAMPATIVGVRTGTMLYEDRLADCRALMRQLVAAPSSLRYTRGDPNAPADTWSRGNVSMNASLQDLFIAASRHVTALELQEVSRRCRSCTPAGT